MPNLAAVLALLSPAQKKCAMMWTGYSMPFLPLLASAVNKKAIVTTEDDSSFLLTRLTIYATTVAAPPVELASPQVTVSFQLGSNLMFPDGNAVHAANFTVNASDHRGHELEFPVMLQPQAQLQGFANNLTATDLNLYITLFGIRIFSMAKPLGGL